MISSGIVIKNIALASTNCLLVSVSWRRVFWRRMHMWCYWQWLRTGQVKKSHCGRAATTAGHWLSISGPSLGKHTTQTSAVHSGREVHLWWSAVISSFTGQKAQEGTRDPRMLRETVLTDPLHTHAYADIHRHFSAWGSYRPTAVPNNCQIDYL